MKKSIKSANLEYPLVIRKVLNELVFSVPDLGYWKTIPLKNDEKIEGDKLSPSESSKTSKNNEVIKIKAESEIHLNNDFLNQINEALIEAWSEVELHVERRKWVPPPSTFKQSLQKSEKDFTLPEFTAELKKYIQLSENTIRREISRGVIQCYQTEGGHRRIPFSELELYLKKIRTDSSKNGMDC